MCAVFMLQFNCGFFISNAGGEVELITSYKKLQIIPFRTIFDHTFVFSTWVVIQFQVFLSVIQDDAERGQN